MTFVRKHPVVTFFVLAYGLSWAYWVPLAIAGVQVGPGSRSTHFPGLLGPAFAAFIVTGTTDGKRGIVALARRLVMVSRPRAQFWFYALSPLLFLLAALLAARAARMPLPPLSDFALYSGLPPLGLPAIVLLVVLFNGFGEEIGWRGFALVPLQRRFGPLGGTFVLAVLWAGWHTPTFFIVETYRAMTWPILVGGFGLGICAGALVLSRIAQRTSGSILAPALWHAAYNMTSATAASRGMIAAVTTTAVMLWAVALLVAAARGHSGDRRGGAGASCACRTETVRDPHSDV
jgi:membrane protease YdiL (CAAX protease family)